MQKINVLFVCMGNICRSPTAEGVFTRLVNTQQLDQYFVIDSAGTHAYHIGSAPDSRSQQAALERGVDLASLRARKVTYADFEEFDHVLVMDNDNYATLMSACPVDLQHKITYFLDYAPQLKVKEVPDPYYGDGEGFGRVLDLIEEASVGFLHALQAKGCIPVTKTN